jgi:hypothetical protein
MCGNRCDFGGVYNYCDDEKCNKGVGGYRKGKDVEKISEIKAN